MSFQVPDEIVEEMATGTDMGPRIVNQCFRSLYIYGDNTLEKALSRGALNARELYPDVPVVTIEEGAKDFYAKPPILEYDLEAMLSAVN